MTMPLTCSCDDSDDYAWFYYYPADYSILATHRAKRCESCKQLIPVGSLVGEYECYRYPKTDIEEKIYGDGGEIELASKYFCEKCQDIFYSLKELGYCVTLNDSMPELLKEYVKQRNVEK